MIVLIIFYASHPGIRNESTHFRDIRYVIIFSQARRRRRRNLNGVDDVLRFLFFFPLARNEQLGTKAVQQIHATHEGTDGKVRFHQLDITNVESIRRLADHIRKSHGGLDILINNAGIAFQVSFNS